MKADLKIGGVNALINIVEQTTCLLLGNECNVSPQKTQVKHVVCREHITLKIIPMSGFNYHHCKQRPGKFL